MKLTFVIIVALIAGAGTASAQDGPTVGVKAGVNFSTVSFDEGEPVIDSSNRAGLVAGLFASLPMSSRVSFQPEILYAMRRTTLNTLGTEAALKVDYFELGALGDIRLNNGPWRLSLVLGPSLAIRSRARIEALGESIDASDQVERTDFGLVTGLAVATGQFVIDGRYVWGLKDVASGEDSARSRVLSMTAGWRFR